MDMNLNSFSPVDVEDMRTTCNTVLTKLNIAFSSWKVGWEDEHYVARVDRSLEGEAALGHPNMIGMAPWISKDVATWLLKTLASDNGSTYAARKNALLQVGELVLTQESLPTHLLGVKHKGVSSETILSWMLALYRAQMTAQLQMDRLLEDPMGLVQNTSSNGLEELRDMNDELMPNDPDEFYVVDELSLKALQESYRQKLMLEQKQKSGKRPK